MKVKRKRQNEHGGLESAKSATDTRGLRRYTEYGISNIRHGLETEEQLVPSAAQ
jgi:hypothetical protein